MADKGAAIVTGGASGIGFAVARQLLIDGWSVLIADRSRDGLERAAGDLKAFGSGKLKHARLLGAPEAHASMRPLLFGSGKLQYEREASAAQQLQ